MIDLWDVLAFVGIILLGVGLWLVAPALSLTVVGALLTAAGWFGARVPRPPKRGKA